MNIELLLCQRIVDLLELDHLSPEEDFDEAGISSIDRLEIIALVEREFGKRLKRLKLEEAKSISTVRALAAWINQ